MKKPFILFTIIALMILGTAFEIKGSGGSGASGGPGGDPGDGDGDGTGGGGGGGSCGDGFCGNSAVCTQWVFDGKGGQTCALYETESYSNCPQDCCAANTGQSCGTYS